MIVLDILLVLLLVALGLVALILIVPLHFRVEGSADDDDGLWWRARIAWGFGLVAVHTSHEGTVLRLLGIRVARLSDDPNEDADAREARRQKRRDKAARRSAKRSAKRAAKPEKEEEGRRGLWWFLSRRGLIVALAKRYLRTLHLRGEIDGVIGLADPTETARLYQVLVALDALLPEGLIAVEIDWVEEVVALRGEFGGWVWPLQIAAITAWLFVDRRSWRALRAA